MDTPQMGECPASAELGDLRIDVQAPEAAPVDIRVVAADGSVQRIDHAGVLSLSAGPFRVEARRTRSPGTLVGRAYVGRVESMGLCLRPGSETQLRVVYELDPASERLYLSDRQGGKLLAFDAPALLAGGASAPVAVFQGGLNAPRHIAFDSAGRLWVVDSQKVVAYARESLVGSGAPMPSIVLEGPAVIGASSPAAGAIAFDGEGALWLAKVAEDRVLRFSAESVAQSGSPMPTSSIQGAAVQGPSALAFDSEGNLWVGSADDRVLMYRKERLAADIADAPDLRLAGRTPGPSINALRTPSSLAFDASGNLWVSYFASNVLARYTPAERTPPAGTPELTATPAVQLRIQVLALLSGMAFDEAGGLWFPGLQGRIVRLASGKLSASSQPTADTTLEPAGLNYAEHFAFNPPSASLPLAF